MGVLQDVRAAIAEAKRSLDKQVASPALRMLIQGAAIAAAFWAGAGLLCVIAVSLALVLSIAALSLLGLGAVLFFVALTAGAWAFVLSWAAAWAYIAMSTLGWASKAMHRSWASLASQAPVPTRRRAVGPSTPSKATPSPAVSDATSPPAEAASAADADASGSGHEGQAAAPQDDAWRGHQLPASIPPFALSEAPLHQHPQHQQTQQALQQQQHQQHQQQHQQIQQQQHHERQHPATTTSNQVAPAAQAQPHPSAAPVPFPQHPAPSDPAPASNVVDVDDILSASTQQPLPAGPAVMPGASSPQHPHAGHAAQHLVRRKVSPLPAAMSRPVPVL